MAHHSPLCGWCASTVGGAHSGLPTTRSPTYVPYTLPLPPQLWPLLLCYLLPPPQFSAQLLLVALHTRILNPYHFYRVIPTVPTHETRQLLLTSKVKKGWGVLIGSWAVINVASGYVFGIICAGE